MNDNISQEIESALEVDRDIAEPGQGTRIINREGFGHSVNIGDSTSTLNVGVIALILLGALPHSESRNRLLQAQVAAANE